LEGLGKNTHIPISKIHVLSRFASTCRTQAIERMSLIKRLATLTAFTIIHTISAQDNVIDYMERYFSELFNGAKKNDDKNWIHSKKDFKISARNLSEVCLLILDESIPDQKIRDIIFSKVSRDNLKSSIGTVDTLTTSVDQDFNYKELFRYYKSIRRFLPELLTTIEFKSSKAGHNVLLSWNFLRDIEGKTGKNKFMNAPIEDISASWEKVIFKNDGRINPCAYTFWVIEKMLECIKNYDIYLENSERYGNPRSNLIQCSEWENLRPKVLKILGWSMNASESLKPLKKLLDDSFKDVVKNWNKNKSVRIDMVNGQEKIILDRLDKLVEPESLILLRKRIESLLPNTDLPSLLMEIAQITKFTEQFTHISQSNSRIKDLDISICAVLIANACNIGLKPLVQKGIPALEYDRLVWVEQNYLRKETLILANAVIIEYLSKLYLTKSWGNSNIVSADGLRHIVPLKTIYAKSNPHYFGIRRGLTSYNLISDIFGSLNRLIITGTLRDSLYLLELVLGQETILKPSQIMTDTAGYSDIIFGLFALLGFQFSPRIADSGGAKIWRFDSSADYGVLNNFSKSKLRENLIVKYWDDIIRIAGSLELGTINPTSLIQMLQRRGKPTILGRAIGEFGRIHKTLHLLKVMSDNDYRRDILTQLNRGETENGLERIIMYGKKGELYRPTREGQEEQLNSLGLVSNIIVLWNTIYIQAALETIQKVGCVVQENDKKHLSPLKSDHINIVGYYPFNLPDEVLSGSLRPLKEIDVILFSKF
jgi:TnpA family transposase